MKARVTTKLNDVSYTFEFEGGKTREMLHYVAVLGNPPKSCSRCGEPNVRLDGNKDKEGNIYINVVCPNCNARAKLGEYRSGGFFWHDFTIYKPKDKTSEEPPPELQEAGEKLDEADDLPF